MISVPSQTELSAGFVLAPPFPQKMLAAALNPLAVTAAQFFWLRRDYFTAAE